MRLEPQELQRYKEEEGEEEEEEKKGSPVVCPEEEALPLRFRPLRRGAFSPKV